MEKLPFPFVGETLRRLRKSRGKTIEELAEAASSGKSQISRIENGKQEPRLSTIGKILDNLGVSEEEFLRLYLRLARGERALLEWLAPGEPAIAEEEELLPGLGALLESWPAKPRRGYLEFRDFLVTFNVVPLRRETPGEPE